MAGDMMETLDLNSFVIFDASRAVVPKWTNIPDGEVWAGIPAKCIKRADGTKPE